MKDAVRPVALEHTLEGGGEGAGPGTKDTAAHCGGVCQLGSCSAYEWGSRRMRRRGERKRTERRGTNLIEQAIGGILHHADHALLPRPGPRHHDAVLFAETAQA